MKMEERMSTTLSPEIKYSDRVYRSFHSLLSFEISFKERGQQESRKSYSPRSCGDL